MEEWLLFTSLLMLDPDQIQKQDILVVGDSEAVHAKMHVQEFVQPWEQAEVRAKGGTSTEQWARGMLKSALRGHGKQPDVLVIFLGTNDLWRKEVTDLEPFFAEIPGVDCVWVGPVAGDGRKWAHTPKLRAAVGTRCAWVESEDIPLYDKWHPTHAGIATWLGRVWAAKPQSRWWPWASQ